jgi:hypothetical protein
MEDLLWGHWLGKKDRWHKRQNIWRKKSFLVSLGYLTKKCHKLESLQQHKFLFLTILEPGSLTSKLQQISCQVKACSVVHKWLCVLTWQKGKRISLRSFCKGANPIHEAPPSWSNHPSVPLSIVNTISLRVRFDVWVGYSTNIVYRRRMESNH